MPQPFSCTSCQTALDGNLVTPGQNTIDFNQQLRFAEIRRELVRLLPGQDVDGVKPLAGWRPGSDLGSFLLDSWAYIGDVLGFYGNLAGAESLLLTARQRRSLRQLGSLLGYRPRPAAGARAEIAAVVAKNSAPNLGQTAYRASPSLSSPAQVFEASADSRADWRVNEFVLQPIWEQKPVNATDGLLLDAATATPLRNVPVVFLWFDNFIKSHTTQILDVSQSRELDGQTYTKIMLPPKSYPVFSAQVMLEDVAVQSPSQRAFARTELFVADIPVISYTGDLVDGFYPEIDDVLGLKPGGYSGNTKFTTNVDALTPADKTQSLLQLDSVYRAIKTGDIVILQSGAKYAAHRVTETLEVQVGLQGTDPALKIPITQLKLCPSVNLNTFVTAQTANRLVVHYNLYDIGRIARPAHTELTPELVATNSPLKLAGLHDATPPEQTPKEFILEDANGRGVLVEATLKVGPTGEATLAIVEPTWTGGLRVPVKAYGNVVRVTRGETVTDEILGSGDASQPGQTFTLTRKPLTYLPVKGAPEGRQTTLSIRVDGVLWHERPSFYGVGPTDAVYIVRHDDDQNTSVIFGDGIHGARLPTGSNNVRATYRWGAGAASPPPGGINQVARGVPDLQRISSPIVAYGGTEAETARDIRKCAPASALILGRCVSLTDYAARVAATAGVRNSKVELAWDDTRQAAVVQVWYLPASEGGAAADDIVADLQALSEPGTQINATLATPKTGEIAVGLAVHPDHVLAAVEAAVAAALLDPETGTLAAENTPLGGVISRSALIAVIRTIPGVADVTTLQYNPIFGNIKLSLNQADSFPRPGLAIPAGQYLDFTGARAKNLVVRATFAEVLGCVDAGS